MDDLERPVIDLTSGSRRNLWEIDFISMLRTCGLEEEYQKEGKRAEGNILDFFLDLCASFSTKLAGTSSNRGKNQLLCLLGQIGVVEVNHDG